ncbi:GNAT family N-acetyltransferase [Algirhabdus cladophorae]|uniref:GNAT family N-acetyltransferase n=1 Tax=Algirhabdus cladophorae TaxID=3377108 RepID=UPI003B84A51B
MTVRNMTELELNDVLGWATREGWNPGVEDAPAFFAADPNGFFVKDVDGCPVAAISVVNHSNDFAFLGLYLCLPGYRGRGYGMEVWRHGLAYAGRRCVGLDGVAAQQDNYRISGFRKTGRTVRYQGVVSHRACPNVVAATTLDRSVLLEMERIATGAMRNQFMANWFSRTRSRRTMVLKRGSEIAGFATARECGLGIKIGPIQAENAQDALDLLRAVAPQQDDAPVFVDVPDTAQGLSLLLQQHGFEPVFETARMYLNTPPIGQPPPYHAIACMELG